jgi:hypothetical protein
MCYGKRMYLGVLVVLAFSLASAKQLRADAVVDFNYSYGGNTFAWQLPTNPTPDKVFPGIDFELNGVYFTENGTSMVGNLAFWNSAQGGGFQLWTGFFDYLLNASGDSFTRVQRALRHSCRETFR